MSAEKRIEKVTALHGTFYCWSNDLITRQLKKYKAHTRNELALVRDFLRPEDCIIDIGAHIGTFSIAFAKFLDHKAAIHAFEADVQNFDLLTRNISENKMDQVVFAHQEIIAANGQYFDQHNDTTNNTGEHYFLPNEHGSNGHKSLALDNWHRDELAGRKVDFLKIDVEGAELSVLQSGKALIETHRPLIYLEVNAKALHRFGTSATDLEQFLGKMDYEFFYNAGPRNSQNDTYKLAKISRLDEVKGLFDCMAIWKGSDR